MKIYSMKSVYLQEVGHKYACNMIRAQPFIQMSDD